MGIGYCNRCKRYDGHDTNCPTVVGEPGEQQLRSRIEQLTARVRELEEENARLRTVPMKYRRMAFNAQLQDENNELRAQLVAAQEECEFQRNAHKQAEELMLEQSNQLAAEQLNNKLLRDALEAVIKVHGYESGIPVEALAQPSDTSALDAYVAEKVKDVQLQDIQMAGISTAAIGYWKEDDSIHPDYDTPALRDVAKLYANYESRTKQRDLAIEWLERCAVHVRPTATIFYEEIVKAINAIKESDGTYKLAKDRSR